MISVEDARSRVLAGLLPTGPEIVGLAEAWGRVTAQPVVARLTQPPADVSAMDGYALRAADAPLGATLKVIGTAPAGHPFVGQVGPGEAVRLFTGSVLPPGADTVLLQEDATAGEAVVQVREAAQPGRHIRRKGQDFTLNDILLPAGRQLSARDIGLAAAANHPWLVVHRRPRIVLLATGDEIALPGEPLPPGGIVSSNTHALAALVHSAGANPVVMPVAADDVIAIATAADAARGADMLVTTGGASVGDHDLVQKALATRGMEVDFWKIAMRPGKPLMHGRLGPVPVLGLPGNPVSSMVCAILFLLPALAALSGLPAAALATMPARLGATLPANDRRADFLRASLLRDAQGTWVATAFTRQDSALLRLLSDAQALILRPPFAPELPAGATVDVIDLAALKI
jgi:molybdopterin molybdotransferase